MRRVRSMGTLIKVKTSSESTFSSLVGDQDRYLQHSICVSLMRVFNYCRINLGCKIINHFWCFVKCYIDEKKFLNVSPDVGVTVSPGALKYQSIIDLCF